MVGMTQKAAVEIVRIHMQQYANGAQRAYIYTWDPGPHGTRVVECGWSTPTGGACYMSSDPDGLGVCAAVERAVIDLMDNDDRELGEGSEVSRQLDVLDFMLNRKD